MNCPVAAGSAWEYEGYDGAKDNWAMDYAKLKDLAYMGRVKGEKMENHMRFIAHIGSAEHWVGPDRAAELQTLWKNDYDGKLSEQSDASEKLELMDHNYARHIASLIYRLYGSFKYYSIDDDLRHLRFYRCSGLNDSDRLVWDVADTYVFDEDQILLLQAARGYPGL